ncbi:uncharacterized protein ACA1_183610 [Acanthamoeba castellanii str. Neff]|uniref:Uncharacterized protein n=1 Tax=Acanthamoeba castellanii (strain ATCC 30010 / Neff) TaxID=1257118 RepID=L8H8D2_ACACF|nr:uncharacterized protein ACA1_183610 [Acanthamoeba castellanii str. Neff]ELR21425.1 hypothetical protein ACA1_183610 [Acanthamoeba castellanii str. Neff]
MLLFAATFDAGDQFVGVAMRATDNTTASFALSEARASLTGIPCPRRPGRLHLPNTIEVITVDANCAIQTEHTAHTLQVIIAGGITQFNIDSENKNATATLTDRVDIFDVATGKRTTSKLPSGARGYITAVATKDFVFFAAGLKKAAYTINVDIIYQDTSNAVDVYHVKSGEWRKLTLAGGASMWATGATRLDLRGRRAQLHRPA